MFLSVSCIYAEDNATALEDVNIDSNDVSMYYKNGTRLNVELSDSSSNPVSDASLRINVNGQNYTRTTNEMGTTSLAINLSPGKYLANIYFLGNDMFAPSSKTVNIKVLPTIEGNDLVKYYKNESQYYATFLDSDGDVLDGVDVKFNINGVFYTRQTNQNGVAKLNINLDAGNYILTAYNPKDGFAYSNKIKVLPTINSTNLEKIYRDSHQYWVTVKDNGGNLLSYRDVEFNVNGVFYTRQTNKYGNAKLNINLPEGQYIITAYNTVTGEALSNKIKVNAYSDTKLTTKNYVFKASDDDTIRATLTNKLNYGVAGETINLNIGNKKYSAITDDSGVASFYLDLPKGNYSLSFNHEANSIYSAASAKSTVETYDGVKANILGHDEIMFVGDDYRVNLYDKNNKPFANQTVYMEINSEIVSDVTDENGTASFKMDFPADVHDVYLFYNGTDYKFTRSTAEVLLIESVSTTLRALTPSVTEGIGEKMYAGLSSNSIKLPNQKVIIEINGKNYTRTTNDDGLVNMTINLKAGTYNVNYYYLGDDLLVGAFNSSTLTVIPRVQTKLSVISGATFHRNSGLTYNIELTADKALPNKQVQVKVGSKTFVQNTDSSGIVRININDFKEGSYAVSYSFAGDNVYAPTSGSAKVSVTEIPMGYGYWVRSFDMYNLNLASLASQGTKHILLHSYVFTSFGKSAVSSWIKQANNYGITVHIWMQVAYDGGWHALSNADGTFNYNYINSKINEAKSYASVAGVGGVHFDYLRYGGTAYKFPKAAESINYFVKNAVSAIKAINSKCIVSAAVMPEPNSMLYYDGQDIPTISKYLDVIVPMIYKGNYNQNTAWIQSITKWFVEHSNGAQIWSGLQTYGSDTDVSKLSVAELSGDAQACLNGGASGVIMFRWGVTNFINFNNLKLS